MLAEGFVCLCCWYMLFDEVGWFLCELDRFCGYDSMLWCFCLGFNLYVL